MWRMGLGRGGGGGEDWESFQEFLFSATLTGTVPTILRHLPTGQRSTSESVRPQQRPPVAARLVHRELDGLARPGGYLAHLRELVGPDVPVWVEKIAKEGKEILANSGLPIVAANDLGDAAKKIVAEVAKAA